jgi:hypothetical protein
MGGIDLCAQTADVVCLRHHPLMRYFMAQQMPLKLRSFLWLNLCGVIGAVIGLAVQQQLHFYQAIVILGCLSFLLSTIIGIAIQIITFKRKNIGRLTWRTLCVTLIIFGSIITYCSVNFNPKELFQSEFRLELPASVQIKHWAVIPDGLEYYVLFVIAAPDDTVLQIVQNLNLQEKGSKYDSFDTDTQNYKHQFETHCGIHKTSMLPEWFEIPVSNNYAYYSFRDVHSEAGNSYDLLWVKDKNLVYYSRIWQ